MSHSIAALHFTTIPVVEFGGCRFENTPIIWQHDDTPMISIEKEVDAGFTTSIPIFYKDGAYVAKVVGSRIVPGPDFKKFDLRLSHPAGRTVCTLNGQPAFEIVRDDAAALKTAAELYTPSGYFVQVKGDTAPHGLRTDGSAIRFGNVHLKIGMMRARIGLLTKSDGSLGVGVG